MADALRTVLIVLYFLSWPFVKLFQVFAFVLSPFWVIGQFILLPVTYLVHVLLSLVLFPFRLQLLDRVETIYIYLGIAGLIGCFTGAILYLSFNLLSSTLRIDAAASAKPRYKETGRTAAEFRATRRRRKEDMQNNASNTPLVRSSRPTHGQRGIGAQSILEEEDTNFR